MGGTNESSRHSNELSAGFVLELLGGTPRLQRSDFAHTAQPSVLAGDLNVDHPAFAQRAG